jgi:uncharacterized membrane protein YfcA
VTWIHYVALVAAGFGAGYINTLAGSGSLLTLPLLIFLGLPAPVANGTNRVAILLQNVVGVASFHQRKVLDVKSGLWLAMPAIVGSILGARIAVELNEMVMRTTIGILMLVMAVVVLLRPKRWLEGHPEARRKRPDWIQIVIFFAIGVYGGFIQAGVGVFLLAGLVLGAGFDIVRANAVKVFIVLLFTVFALGVFVLHDQVRWDLGLVLAIGNMLGARVAARMAVERGGEFVRWVLVAVVVASGIALLLGLGR